MDTLHRHLAHLLCCIPLSCPAANIHDPKHIDTSQKRASALPLSPSISPSLLSQSRHHTTTVPHYSSDCFTDDAQALNHIFSSSSSIRAYRTTTTTTAAAADTVTAPATKSQDRPQHDSRPSFEHDFRIGSRSHSSQKHQPSRIERLGERIRQKLSDTKLSRPGFRQNVHDADADVGVGLRSINSGPAPQADQALGASPSSVGLTELLTSGNASRGGYDSDAHTIKTPLLHSNPGTLHASSGRRQDIDTVLQKNFPDLSPGSSPAAAAAPAPAPAAPAAPAAVQATSSSSSSWVPVTVQAYSEQTSPSSILATPSKTSFRAALETSLNESPSQALRRLNLGIVNGTIQKPGTPHLQALRNSTSSSNEHASALVRSDSFEQRDMNQVMHKALRRLSDCVESFVRQSTINDDSEGKQSSLLLDLDPALINYIRKFASSDETPRSEMARQAGAEAASLEARDNEPVSATVENQSTKQTDEDSIHLFNMRISQRLGSFSQIPVVSPASSAKESKGSSAARDGMTRPRRTMSAASRYPGFIVPEHTRRPSDPQTRRLFEGPDADQTVAKSTWLTVPSIPTSVATGTRIEPSRDGASSVYQSDEGSRSLTTSPISTRRGSLVNPHSLAVGGRSFSINLPYRLSTFNTDQVLTTGHERRLSGQRSSFLNGSSEDSWNMDSEFGNQPRRFSLLQNKLSPGVHGPSPSQKTRKEQTASAEVMSEISLGPLLNQRGDGTTDTSQQCLGDHRNELFSEVEDSTFSLHCPKPCTPQNNPNSDLPARASPVHLLPTSLPTTRDDADDAEDFMQQVHNSNLSLGGEAVKSTQDETNHSSSSNFLRAPRFDGRGSTQSNTNTSSLQLRSSRSNSPAEHYRSRSAEPTVKRSSTSMTAPSNIDQIPTVVPEITTKSWNRTLRGQATDAKSIGLDLSGKFKCKGPSSINYRLRSASTPLQGRFRVWSRFPIHTREERNGVATLHDRVHSKDFQPAESPLATTIDAASPSSRAGSATPLSLKILPRSVHDRIHKAKSNSLNLRTKVAFISTTAQRTRRRRTGIWDVWRKSHTDGEHELPNCSAHTGGHQNNFGIEDKIENEKLECWPGQGSSKSLDVQKWCAQVGAGVSTSSPLTERYHTPPLEPSSLGEDLSPLPATPSVEESEKKACFASI